MDKETKLYIEKLFRKLHAITECGFGSSATDRKANIVLDMLYDEGVIIWVSEAPETDGYHVAIVSKNDTTHFIFKDKDVDLNFEDVWEEYLESTN